MQANARAFVSQLEMAELNQLLMIQVTGNPDE